MKRRFYGLFLIFLFCLLGCGKKTDAGQITKLEDLDYKRLGSLDGTITIDIIEDSGKIKVGDTNPRFKTKADMIVALKSKKIDALITALSIAKIIVAREPGFRILDEPIYADVYGFPLGKDASFKEEFNKTLEEIKKSGTYAELEKKWVRADYDEQIALKQSWDGSNGTFDYWVDVENPPMSFVCADKSIGGFEIDLLMHIAQKMNYNVNFTTANFDGLIPAIVSGKANVVSGSISITEERKKYIDFSLPEFEDALVAVVLNDETVKEENFFTVLKNSFYRTFILEKRWTLFAEGIGATICITLLSVIFGTIFGFFFFLCYRKNNKYFNKTIDVIAWTIHGMPMVVLLMILFYIIFGKSSASGLTISIISFSFVFSLTVFGLLKLGASTIPKEQYETATALGYSKSSAFFQIILPQIVRVIISSYKSDIVTLLKSTAIVGYISVEDLTKMSDIIRSKTYEAFFPLIATAIIYILLEIIITQILEKIQINTDPKKRSKEKILKGVKTDDRA